MTFLTLFGIWNKTLFNNSSINFLLNFLSLLGDFCASVSHSEFLTHVLCFLVAVVFTRFNLFDNYSWNYKTNYLPKIIVLGMTGLIVLGFILFPFLLDPLYAKLWVLCRPSFETPWLPNNSPLLLIIVECDLPMDIGIRVVVSWFWFIGLTVILIFWFWLWWVQL